MKNSNGKSKSTTPQSFVFVMPQRAVKRVFLHCSASDSPEHDNVGVITKWHIDRGFSTIGYHFYINKAGEIFPGRDIEHIPAAQKGFNTNSIAICAGGLNDFTEKQLGAVKILCKKINDMYKGNITFHGHCEVDKNKTCPVFDYKRLLNLNELGKMK